MTATSLPTPSVVRSGECACCHLASTRDRDRLTHAFVADGLTRRHKVMCLRGHRPGARGLADGLEEPFGEALREGRLVVAPADSVMLGDGALAFERVLCWAREQHTLALRDGWAGMSAAAEMPAAGDLPAAAHRGGPSAEPRVSSMRLLCHSPRPHRANRPTPPRGTIDAPGGPEHRDPTAPNRPTPPRGTIDAPGGPEHRDPTAPNRPTPP
ncbi:MAG TPA: MEDS domain-containing protein, partial [Baekduia sp.]|uniref:MEDS domain-containing protein n=1 Tax=Baekduia sp. TaxID=2600305 RepID=UPI002C46361C